MSCSYSNRSTCSKLQVAIKHRSRIMTQKTITELSCNGTKNKGGTDNGAWYWRRLVSFMHGAQEYSKLRLDLLEYLSMR